MKKNVSVLLSKRMGYTHKQAFNMMYGLPKDTPHSLASVAKLSKIKLSVLKKVFARGVGAYKTNPSSVRPTVSSPEEWAQARVYSFAHKVCAKLKLDHDTDLV